VKINTRPAGSKHPLLAAHKRRVIATKQVRGCSELQEGTREVGQDTWNQEPAQNVWL